MGVADWLAVGLIGLTVISGLRLVIWFFIPRPLKRALTEPNVNNHPQFPENCNCPECR